MEKVSLALENFDYMFNLLIINIINTKYHLRTASNTTKAPNPTNIEKTIAIVVQKEHILPPPMHLLKNTQ